MNNIIKKIKLISINTNNNDYSNKILDDLDGSNTNIIYEILDKIIDDIDCNNI